MARYKIIDTNPRLLPVDLSKQLLPGTFEHALNHLIDHEIDLSGFDARYGKKANGVSVTFPRHALLARGKSYTDPIYRNAVRGMLH